MERNSGNTSRCRRYHPPVALRPFFFLAVTWEGTLACLCTEKEVFISGVAHNNAGGHARTFLFEIMVDSLVEPLALRAQELSRHPYMWQGMAWHDAQ